MSMPTAELLRKAVLGSTDGTPGATPGGGDFGGATQAPLSVEQAKAFIELMSAGQPMLSDVQRVSSSAAKWQQTIIGFGSRIMRPGVEATRLSDSDRKKPSTGKVEISTVLTRGEVPVSDESLEDIAGGDLAAAIERMVADQAGADIEELMLNGDTTSGDDWLALLDGWIVQARSGKAASSGIGFAANATDAAAFGQDYQEIFRVLLTNLPDRYRKGIETDGRFWIPKRTETQYRDQVSNRGTSLGDISLTKDNDLVYQGIKIVGVPNMAITNGASNFLLASRNNLIAGFHRAIKLETFRDPREGATSFVVTARVDAQVAVPNATCLAYNVDVSV